jgi:hypothetical protein
LSGTAINEPETGNNESMKTCSYSKKSDGAEPTGMNTRGDGLPTSLSSLYRFNKDPSSWRSKGEFKGRGLAVLRIGEAIANVRSIGCPSKEENEPMGLARRIIDAWSEDESDEGWSSPSMRIDFVGILIATGFAISWDPSRWKLDWKPDKSSENSR